MGLGQFQNKKSIVMDRHIMLISILASIEKPWHELGLLRTLINKSNFEQDGRSVKITQMVLNEKLHNYEVQKENPA